jgi:hypothetical protein
MVLLRLGTSEDACAIRGDLADKLLDVYKSMSNLGRDIN